MTELSPKDIASVDCGYWAAPLYKIRLQASAFSFKGREYQLEPMRFTGRRTCYLKAAQSFGDDMKKEQDCAVVVPLM